MYPTMARRGDAHTPVDTDHIVRGSKLLGAMRDCIRRKHSSIRTEQAYLDWAKRYILFHGKRHPRELGGLPYALARKYPNAAKRWGWQYLFPAGSTAVDPRSGKTRRHHLGESAIQRAVKQAITAAGIHKHGSCHTLRHSQVGSAGIGIDDEEEPSSSLIWDKWQENTSAQRTLPALQDLICRLASS